MKKVIHWTLVSLLCFSLFCCSSVSAEEITFGKLLDDLAQAEKNLKENQAAIEGNQGQINQDNAKIKTLQQEIENMSKEADDLQQEIASSNTEITKKREQTKSLMTFLQVSRGDNLYLEYVFAGDSVTDLIYRVAVVEQITDYNEEIITELQNLIQANEDRKVALAKKQEEHEQKVKDLTEEISKLNNNISATQLLSPGLEEEVQTKRTIVESYRKLGCEKRTDVIGRDCAVEGNPNAIFVRPIREGYITSFTGYRGGTFHKGLDMGSPYGRNTPIYSVGNGVIRSIWNDNPKEPSKGALCITIEYQGPDGKYYTAIYGHLSRYANIYVGMKVTPNTLLGYMGDTGYAFGIHLHLELWPCRLYVDGNCSTWSRYVAFAQNLFDNTDYKGAESVISFPKRIYQSWYSQY